MAIDFAFRTTLKHENSFFARARSCECAYAEHDFHSLAAYLSTRSQKTKTDSNKQQKILLGFYSLIECPTVIYCERGNISLSNVKNGGYCVSESTAATNRLFSSLFWISKRNVNMTTETTTKTTRTITNLLCLWVTLVKYLYAHTAHISQRYEIHVISSCYCLGCLWNWDILRCICLMALLVIDGEVDKETEAFWM